MSYVGRLRQYTVHPKRYVEHLVYASHPQSAMFNAAIVAIPIPLAWLRWVILILQVVYILSSERAIYIRSRWGGLARSLVVPPRCPVFMACAFLPRLVPAKPLARARRCMWLKGR